MSEWADNVYINPQLDPNRQPKFTQRGTDAILHVLIAGNDLVGKTSLVLALVDKPIPTTTPITITSGIEFLMWKGTTYITKPQQQSILQCVMKENGTNRSDDKVVQNHYKSMFTGKYNLDNNAEFSIKLYCWDTLGPQQPYHMRMIQPLYKFHYCQLILIDLSKGDSYQQIKDCVSRWKRQAVNNNAPNRTQFVIVGTKADIINQDNNNNNNNNNTNNNNNQNSTGAVDQNNNDNDDNNTDQTKLTPNWTMPATHHDLEQLANELNMVYSQVSTVTMEGIEELRAYIIESLIANITGVSRDENGECCIDQHLDLDHEYQEKEECRDKKKSCSLM